MHKAHVSFLLLEAKSHLVLHKYQEQQVTSKAEFTPSQANRQFKLYFNAEAGKCKEQLLHS